MPASSRLPARFRHFVAARPRLTAALLAIGLGGLAACGFQPLGLWPLTIVCVAGLIELLCRAATRRQAFGLGWAFGIGHFSIGNTWIATAFTFQSEMPEWLGAIAVVLLSFYLAVYPALAAWAAWLLVRWRRRDDRMAMLGTAFAASWIVTEWMRAWVFTGFAWNPLGIVLLGPFDSQGPAVLAPWIGTYGLAGLVILLAAGLRWLVREAMGAPARRRLVLAAGGTVATALLSAAIMLPATWLERREGGRVFTIVQPGINQETVPDPRFYEINFQKLARLSGPRIPNTPRMVFWPESGLADYLRDGYPRQFYRSNNYGSDPQAARERIGRVIGPYSLIMTGAVDLVIEDGDDVAARNSVTTLDADGDILASYSKAHLVPYGEYLALRWLLEPLGLRRLVAGSLDFWPGPGPRTFDFGRYGKAGVQVCYEIIFSGEVVDPLVRPDFLFNPSTDAWFGAWGPPQHLAQARLRAIEEGLPVLRATTNGISAVIDADGIVRASLPRPVAGRIDGTIPPPDAPTPFSRYGNALPLLFALFLAAVCAIALRRTPS